MTEAVGAIQGFADLEKIGEGGMGVVYRATQLSLKRKVALKLLSSETSANQRVLARFRREAEILASLNHEGIVHIYDIGEENGRVFFSMELVEGGSLDVLLKGQQKLPENEALRIALETAEALASAHAHGIIHRDVKPSNILLKKDKRVKLTDFGLARSLGEDIRLTHQAAFMGTPLYMTPEQALGRDASPASDVYALGLTLYEMLAGTPPFLADSVPRLCHMHAYVSPPPLPRDVAVSSETQAIVMKALRKRPAMRFQDAGQMAEALRKALSALEAGAGSAGTGRADQGGLGFPGAARLAPERCGAEIAVLTAIRAGTKVRMTLHAGEAHRAPVHHYEEIEIDEGQLAELCRAAESALHRNAADPEGTGADVLTAARRLYDDLLPPGIKKALAECSAPLLRLELDDHLVQVPWELLHDGEQYLCQRFAVGRVVHTGQASAQVRETVTGRPLNVLLLADPRSDLPGVRDEGNQILAQLEGHGERVALRCKTRDIPASYVLEHLPESDVLHFAGHAVYEPTDPSRSGWVLQDGILDAGRIRRIGESRAALPMLVFSSACRSVKTQPWAGCAAQSVFGLANAFLLAGVRHYIGAVTDLPDAYGASFAREFYKGLLEGLSIGEAFHRARVCAAADHPESLAWAGYVLYGDPASVYFQAVKAGADEAREQDAAASMETSRAQARSRRRLGAGLAAALILCGAAVALWWTSSRTTPTASPAAAAVPAPVGLNVELMAQCRDSAGQFYTTVVKEGDTLESGDSFQVRVRTQNDANVHVLLLDTENKLTRLFPSPDIASDERVAPNAEHTIPAADRWFLLDQNAGTETVFVVASAARPEGLDQVLADFNARTQSVGRGVAGTTGTAGAGATILYSELRRDVTEALRKQGLDLKIVGFEHK